VPAADVDNRAVPAEVVGGDHGCDRELGSARHGLIEDFAEFRFGGQVVEGRFAAQFGDDGPASANRIGEVAPMLAVLGGTQPAGPPDHRYLRVSTQGVRQRGEVVAAVAALPENAPADQRPEQPTEGLRVGLDRGRQVFGR
jgi:hypothetical protein